MLWTKLHQDLATVLEYTLACAMAILASIFFLLQSFYHYISKSVTKSSFMSSLEFRINIVCSIMVLAAFPLIQYFVRKDQEKREAAPQMAFSVVLTCIGLLGLRTHYRFKSLLKVALVTMTETSQGVAEKLEYFKDMNMVITVSMFQTGISLGIASVDGLTSYPTIARNKFASDLLVMNLNFFEFIIWVTLVLIFYPRRSIVGTTFGASSDGASSRTVPASARHNTFNNYANNNNNNNQNQDDFVKSYSGNAYSSNSGPVRSHNTSSKDRPPSIIPYKTPNDIPRYSDTLPLTRMEERDATDVAQLDAYKTMYDMGSSSIAPISPTKVHFENNSVKFSFDQSRPIGPVPPLRHPQQNTTRIGQQTFVLEVANNEYSNSRQGLGSDQNEFNQTKPTSPTRPPKGNRSPIF
ncbi:hypothetical protein BGZ49_005953 [Haplosporangium sp. Z 27]|nr:hypothetical protein BGZ49_005953 [Haplosporangium sp. Z 27]